jgi:uncharacterized MAPEG superfamily protein
MALPTVAAQQVEGPVVADPRAWGKEAEAGMAARIVEACQNLRSAGTHQG